MTTLIADDISVTYRLGRRRIHAVRGVSFSVSAGETVAIVGESGSGKSSIGRVLAGLQRPTSGRVRWATSDGQDTGASRVQMVFQHPDQSLDPSWSIQRSVSEPLRRLGRAQRVNATERSRAMLARVGLDADFLRRKPKDLSGGQAQRVAVARAIIAEPSIVVLDEPTASLDQTVRARLLTTLAEVQEATGVGYLLVSHDMSTVRKVSDRILVMYLGRVVEEGPAAAVLDNPAHPYTHALLAAVPPTDPNTPWNPDDFSVETALAGGRGMEDMPCPAPGDCADHGANLVEVSPGHRVACRSILLDRGAE
ncbi:ABC transporter ATP-binding protein [Microbacterium trichothecenolyticum]|uniref:ABC transporter ATP-binding protein n=1 Tax=Microbacterium ureisolvens TaxID=2781186 RepID=A0ABS7HZ94_9MICO|nr:MULTISPECIES: ABC transporter ATP-binding protein [Microbacterium]MBW9110455.1 ABC transporter ATP-binding protein [Microbacterium ureisolvens]MBW9120560.1 ABC transporter ATP-binding protein [Microbacterium trichothecenolyticum]